MTKRYGYRSDQLSQRDQIYPNEIAEQRPALATRVDCPGTYHERDPAHSERGVELPETEFFLDPNMEETESAVERFNRRLRGQPFRGERS
jgi:hypothetical protein